jgi:hypothetical protein
MSLLKLFIDSRHRTAGTSEDFTYQLPGAGFDLPDCICYVDDVQLSNTFYGIQEQRNDRIYIREDVTVGFVSNPVHRVEILPPGQYNAITLASALQTALNAGTIGNVYTVIFDTHLGKLKVSTSSSTNFAIFGGQTKDLVKEWNNLVPAAPITEDTAYSANIACGFTTSGLLQGSISSSLTAPSVVDLATYKTLYIHSPDLGEPEAAFGPRGSSGCIRKVVLPEHTNAIVLDRHTVAWGGTKVDAMPLRTIRFRLLDSDGNLVNTQGHDWSLSLYFQERIE